MKQPGLMDKQYGPERMYKNTPRRLFAISIIAVLTVIVFSNWIAVAMAVDDANLTLEGHFGGATYAADVSGNYAYVGQGQDLVVLDISNVSQPSELGRICTGDIVYDIKISGSYAYVADEDNGLVIIDISDPTAPAFAGSYNTLAARSVAVSGSYAYVADYYSGLVIFDISNPAAPTLAGYHNTAGYARGVAVAGSYAYIADDYNGLVIFDISNPTAPVLADTYKAGTARGVAVAGSYAYVVNWDNGLVIIDISNPTASVLAGSYNTAGIAYGVAVSGNYAYIADQSNGLVIIDISNPAAPVLVGSYDTAGDAYDVVVSGSYAYVADGSNGLVIIDISNQAAPALAGSYDTAGYAEGVAVSGSYAYVADSTNGLVIIDISNPAAPMLAGSYNTAGRAYGVAVSGSYAYIADETNGLVIIDISNPAAPTLAGSYNTAGWAYGVAVAGSYAYVADWDNGLVIIDISNQAAPVLAGSYDTAGSAEGVAVAGSYAYVADYADGLVIVDISNQAAPVLAGSYDTAGIALSVAVAGSYAYVADKGNGLVIVDISNPVAPVLAGSYNTTGRARGVAVSGSYAYVADGSEGLVLINISNPAAPALANSYDTEGNTRGVAVSGSYAYVADGNNGLVILNTGLSGTTPAAPTASLSTTLSNTYTLAEPVTLTTTVKNTGTSASNFTLEVTTSNSYSSTRTITIPAGSTHKETFNLNISGLGTYTVTIKMYAKSTLLETVTKTFTINDQVSVKFIEDNAESLKTTAIAEFDKMASVPAKASSYMIVSFGFDQLKNIINNYLKTPTDAVKDKDTSGSITDNDVNTITNEANTTILDIENKIDASVSTQIIRQINSASGENIPETVDIFHLKESVSNVIFEKIKDVFGDILSGTIKDYIIKPLFTQAEENKVIQRDDQFDTYAGSTLFSISDDSKTSLRQRFNTDRYAIASVTDSKALFTIGPYEIPFVGNFSYSLTLTEEQNKFYELDNLKGIIGMVAAGLAVIGVVIVLIVAILGSGGSILIPLVSALPTIIHWLHTITTILIPVVMSLLTVGMIFTVPIIAPEVTYQHDQTLDTVEDIIASETLSISVSGISTTSSYVNFPSTLSMEIRNNESTTVKPITETMIYSPDGRIIDIQRQDPYISAFSSTGITQQLHTTSKPGTYNIVGMVHSGSVATSTAQQEMNVSLPSISITLNTDKKLYSIGETVTISADFSNNEASDISDLIYIIEVSDASSVTADMITLSASSNVTKTLSFTPAENGSYISKATILLGLSEVAAESTGFTVESGEGLLVTATPDTHYPAESDVIVLTTVENIGTVHTNSTINITTYDELAGFSQIYTNEIPVSLATSTSTAYNLLTLPEAAPGIYRTIILAGNYSARSFEYTVTANGTIFTLLDTDKLYYNLTENVIVNATVNDILFNATSATVNATVSDSAGGITNLSFNGSSGHYTSVYMPAINGTYDIEASSSKQGFRSYDDETFVIVGQRSILTTQLDSNILINNSSSTIPMHVTNELSKPIGNAIVTLSGSGINSTKLTHPDGNVSFMVTPDMTGTITLTLDKGGYSAFTQTLYVLNVSTDNFICNLQSGWNMVSVPVMPLGNANVNDIFGSNVTTVFGWTGTRYQQIGLVDELVPKEAYWMLANTGYDQPITGTPPADTSQTLSAGWNMVGPVSGGVSVDSLSNVTTVFGWTGTRYVQITGSQELELTKGYWMLAGQDTVIQV